MAHQQAKLIAEKTVSSAGTAVQFTTSDTEATSLVFTADPDNTGSIYIGLSDVDSTTKVLELEPGESQPITADSLNGHTQMLVASDYWADAETNGNIAFMAALVRR